MSYWSSSAASISVRFLACGSGDRARSRRRWCSGAGRASSAHCGPAPSTAPNYRAPASVLGCGRHADALCEIAHARAAYALRMAVSRSRRARVARKRKRRMDLVINDLTGEEWAALKDAWNGCAYCGATDGPLQRDCVLAISRGGRYTVDNVVPACASCNTSKCNEEVTTWLRRKRLDERAFLTRYLEIRAAQGT